MATQVKAAPFLPNEARHFNGKTVTAATITLNVDVTNEFGPNGVIQEVYEIMQQNATPIIIGQVKTLANGDFDVYFEGHFTELDDYGPNGNDSFLTDLQNRIQARTAAAVRDQEIVDVTGETLQTSGLNLSSATVVAIADLVDDGTSGKAGLVGEGGVNL